METPAGFPEFTWRTQSCGATFVEASLAARRLGESTDVAISTLRCATRPEQLFEASSKIVLTCTACARRRDSDRSGALWEAASREFVRKWALRLASFRVLSKKPQAWKHKAPACGSVRFICSECGEFAQLGSSFIATVVSARLYSSRPPSRARLLFPAVFASGDQGRAAKGGAGSGERKCEEEEEEEGEGEEEEGGDEGGEEGGEGRPEKPNEPPKAFVFVGENRVPLMVTLEGAPRSVRVLADCADSVPVQLVAAPVSARVLLAEELKKATNRADKRVKHFPWLPAGCKRAGMWMGVEEARSFWRENQPAHFTLEEDPWPSRELLFVWDPSTPHSFQDPPGFLSTKLGRTASDCEWLVGLHARRTDVVDEAAFSPVSQFAGKAGRDGSLVLAGVARGPVCPRFEDGRAQLSSWLGQARGGSAALRSKESGFAAFGVPSMSVDAMLTLSTFRVPRFAPSPVPDSPVQPLPAPVDARPSEARLSISSGAAHGSIAPSGQVGSVLFGSDPDPPPDPAPDSAPDPAPTPPSASTASSPAVRGGSSRSSSPHSPPSSSSISSASLPDPSLLSPHVACQPSPPAPADAPRAPPTVAPWQVERAKQIMAEWRAFQPRDASDPF